MEEQLIETSHQGDAAGIQGFLASGHDVVFSSESVEGSINIDKQGVMGVWSRS